MNKDLIRYDEDFSLENYQVLFMQTFKETHSLTNALKVVTKTQSKKIKATLRAGDSDLAKAYKRFVEDAPIHPEANKVVILDNLIWLMNQAKKDEDTQGVLRAITEINKMIKGNLTSSKDTKTIETKLIGIIDLTKKNDEPIVIDI